jgi:glycosyltransferase involved in cell wall biosynthesis
MKFSVIMASRLVPYPSASKDRDGKLLRAVKSVIEQTFKDWELLIIADGCHRTIELFDYIEDDRVKLFKVEHKKLWSGTPRNKGIDEAQGEYIVYLDNDDLYGPEHLQIISEDVKTYDWIWYNDYRYHPREQAWFERQTNICTLGMHGTSNICHKKLDVRWNESDKYAHDYHFVQKLLKFGNHTKTRTPEYFVCHIPGTQQTGGYDL